MKTIFSVTLMAILLSGCDPRVSGVTLLTGDSLMYFASDEVMLKIVQREQAHLPVVNAVPGMRSSSNADYMVGRIAAIRERMILDTAFITLGTNDGGLEDLDIYHLSIEQGRIMDAFNTSTIVYWILPRVSLIDRNVGRALGTQAVIDSIKSEAAQRSNVIAVDFEQYHISKGLGLEMYAVDDIHHSYEGEVQLGNMIAQILDAAKGVQ